MDEGLKAASALDMLLAAYAAGSLSRSTHALVAGHLELSATNRQFVGTLESSLAAAIASGPLQPCARRERRLQAIFAAPEADLQEPTSIPSETDARPFEVLPQALRALAGGPIDTLKWRRRLPGVREVTLPAEKGVTASLYWIGAGREMPSHTHEGSEITLVLRGAFSDVSGHYRRGDIAIADETVDHHPVADHDEDCICFAVSDAPLRLTGRFGRLLNPFLRH